MAITKYQFNTLENLFFYYNVELFDAELPDCLINLSRKNNSAGFFAPERWKDAKTEKAVHEISLNPDTFFISDIYWHQTLVHEMCHLWQQTLGEPPRRGYHDKEWAQKMIAVGLMPSTTGQPGGKITGQNMSDYVIDGGPFQTVFNKISVEELASLRLPYAPNLPMMIVVPGAPATEGAAPTAVAPAGPKGTRGSRSGVKAVYTCTCGTKVWGKPALRIKCGECDALLIEH
ncbi:SprT-like domain-containing protein [Chitinophaga tropicalis]|uniref:SprT domain-containing protein n=1 Tax=Chitinophaga tropicalis TaxID=2683588 RepID=A0A7K1UDR4_9BACT|nr:SprT-like domain-containing protein [Chitinophaga tropicalis]MVT12524.1 sprT domain-containing protein [Chitinophaga tropicalis]